MPLQRPWPFPVESLHAVNVPIFISAVKQFVPESEMQRHLELEEMIDAYNSRSIGKQELQVRLRRVAGRQALKKALLTLFPQVNELHQAQEILLATRRPVDMTKLQQLIFASKPSAAAFALSEACERNNEPAVRMLLQCGADALLPVTRYGSLGQLATLDVAKEMTDGGLAHAATGSAAALVILEGDGWVPANRELMPAAARQRAVALAWIGCKAILPSEPWNQLLIPRVLRAEFGCVRFMYRP